MVRYFPDEEKLELLERVCLRLPENVRADLLARSQDDYLTWIYAFIAVRDAEVTLPHDLNAVFTMRVLNEVALEDHPGTPLDNLRTAVQEATYLPPPLLDTVDL